MSSTGNSQAIALANEMIALGQQLWNVQQQIQGAVQQFGQLTLATVFNAMATAAVAADGQLGAADISPNVAHVIDTRVYTQLSRVISANDLASLEGLLAAVDTLLKGGAVVQQGQAPQLLQKLVGG